MRIAIIGAGNVRVGHGLPTMSAIQGENDPLSFPDGRVRGR